MTVLILDILSFIYVIKFLDTFLSALRERELCLEWSVFFSLLTTHMRCSGSTFFTYFFLSKFCFLLVFCKLLFKVVTVCWVGVHERNTQVEY